MNPARRISVRVPATSANLGCAFDCAALALSLYLDVHVTPRADRAVTIRYTGVTPEQVPTDDHNLIGRTIWNSLEKWNKTRGFDLEIENQIPIGVGLGSSAAAIVAGLAAAYWIAEATLFDEVLVGEASAIEGHPDNVAAAWHGGLTLALQDGERVQAFSTPLPEHLAVLLVVPRFVLPTEKAREVLPKSYSRADAVHNLQRAAVLVAQLFSGRPYLNPALFDDRWHQPYRAELVPGLREALAFRSPEVLGVCLSGAGSAVLVFAKSDNAEVQQSLAACFEKHDIPTESFHLTPDNRGAKGWSFPY